MPATQTNVRCVILAGPLVELCVPRLSLASLLSLSLSLSLLLLLEPQENVGAAARTPDDSVHLCKCSDNAHPADPLKGCDPRIRLKRLQVGHITSPGRVHFKYKLQADRDLPHPHVDFTLTKLMIPLPCMAGYGSCTYSLCGFERYAIEKKICAAWGCKCPVQAGTYYSGLVSIRMPDLRALGSPAYGPVKVEIKFKEGRRAISCVSFHINVDYPNDDVLLRLEPTSSTNATTHEDTQLLAVEDYV